MTQTKQRKPGPLKQATLIPSVPGRAEKPVKPKQLILPWPCSAAR